MKMNSMFLVVLLFAGTLINTSSGQEPDALPGEIIVKFAQQPTAELQDEVALAIGTDIQWEALRHAPHPKGLPGQPHPLSLFRIAKVDLNDIEGNKKQLVNSVQGVTYICFSLTARIFSPINPPLSTPPTCDPPTFNYTTNDPMFVDQWALSKINAQSVWGNATSNPSPDNPDIVIAVLDGGCRLSHRDIFPNLWQNVAELNGTVGIDDDGNGCVDDVFGWNFAGNNTDLTDRHQNSHGTAVSGVAAGRSHNGVGIAGVSNAKIMPVKYYEQSPGSNKDCLLAQSIYYAVDNGAHVLCLTDVFLENSASPLPLLTRDAVEYAHSNGVTVVTSALGNGGDFGFDSAYPNSDPRVIVVGDIDCDMERRRDGPHPNSFLDVVAPGKDVLAPSATANTSYRYVSGTSFSAPHVAGLAALMLSVDPTLTPAQIQTKINANADDLGDVARFSHGIINVDNTLASLSEKILGDVNRDGVANFLDIAPFIAVLANSGYQLEADVNCDGAVNFIDISSFITTLTSP